MARSALRAIASGSMPRSKRALDSLRSLIRFDVSAMPMRSKYADSSRISVVASDTSEVEPPMMPATACGTRAASQMSRSSGVSSRSTSSRVVIVSPAVAVRTTMPRPPSLARSKACSGWLRSSST